MSFDSLETGTRAAAIAAARAEIREATDRLAALEAEHAHEEQRAAQEALREEIDRALAFERTTFPSEGARRAGIARLTERFVRPS